MQAFPRVSGFLVLLSLISLAVASGSDTNNTTPSAGSTKLPRNHPSPPRAVGNAYIGSPCDTEKWKTEMAHYSGALFGLNNRSYTASPAFADKLRKDETLMEWRMKYPELAHSSEKICGGHLNYECYQGQCDCAGVPKDKEGEPVYTMEDLDGRCLSHNGAICHAQDTWCMGHCQVDGVCGGYSASGRMDYSPIMIFVIVFVSRLNL